MTTYTEFIEQTTSEKIVLAHIHCKWQAYTFTSHTGNIHQKTMDFFVSDVSQDAASLTLASDKDSVVSGTYFFDPLTNILYVYSSDIDASDVIVTFKLFFSTAPIQLPHDMDSGEDVYYEPRIKSTSGISVKISDTLHQHSV